MQLPKYKTKINICLFMVVLGDVPVKGHGGCSCGDVSIIDPLPGAASVFNGLAKLLSGRLYWQY